jgi:AraC family transcriptional regulator
MNSVAPNTDLYGKPLKQKQVSAFTLTERFYPPHFRTPEHAHHDALFCLVLDGNYTETYGQKKRECLPSTALFHASDDPHAEHFHEQGGHSFIVEIDKDWISKIREEIKFPNISVDFKNGNLPQLGSKLYREFQKFDSLSPLIIEGLILEITGETARQSLFREKHQKPFWLKEVESYLAERYAEPFSLKEVAKFANIHPVHLAQTFRKFNQTTVGNYLRQIRLENARQNLIQTNKTLTEIAYRNGFSDQSHFTRLFKSEFGITPNQYRQDFR